MTTWEQALQRFEADQGARVAVTTLRAQMSRLRRLAADVGSSPAELTAQRFEAWTASLPCALPTVGEHVTTARAFYRWAVRSGVTDTSPVPAPSDRRRYTLTDKWSDALGAFERAQIAARIAPGTIRRRLQHVRRFAGSIGVDPWHVEPEDYGAWIVQQPITDAVRAAQRDSLRAFYRWAARAGRIAADPTADPTRRGLKLGMPAEWEREALAWRRWMLATGQATTTAATRISHIAALARAHASASPWDITADDLADYMAGKRWAREMRRGFRGTVRGFYGWAVATGRTVHNPAEIMPKVRAGDPSRRPVTDAEYRAALSAAPDEQWRLALRMACELGMRRGEIAQAHAADAADDDGRMTLNVHGKGGKLRRIPVPAGLAAAIRDAGDGYLFPSPDGGHLTPAYIGKRVSQLLPPGVTMHALRHAFATRAYNVNRDVFTVQRLLGHASPATTQRYVQVSDDSMRALVEAVAW